MKNRIIDLVSYLNYHTTLYDAGVPQISDYEWDAKYFELQNLEKETGYYLPESPTQTINYQVVNKLNKITHLYPMLSLQKTKSYEEVIKFSHSKEMIAMLKMDGLTCSLTYSKGKLVAAETRGNGIVGEDILHNALVVRNIPNKINYLKDLVVEGEIICTTFDFEEYNTEFKNPRNFASGSIRLLDSKVCATRNLSFVAWEVRKGLEEYNTLTEKLKNLNLLSFTIVPWFTAVYNNIDKCVAAEEYLREEADSKGYPIDGLVFKFNDIKYGEGLGKTEHHFNNAIAYKFYDEVYNTELIDIEWTMGRTGILTPVAILKPVDTGDSIVERASLHNVSVVRDILGIPRKGQPVELIKSNMIIPQLVWGDKNFDKGERINTPYTCPICGQDTTIIGDNNSLFLCCSNEACEGKLINRIDHYCGKKGMDIKGFSNCTIEKLIDWGWVNTIADIYKLHQYRDEWITKPGFGARSVDNILAAIEGSKQTTFVKFLSALGIPLIGTGVAKELNKTFATWAEFRNAITEKFNFYELDTFGYEKNNSIYAFDYTEADFIVTNYLVFESATTAGRTLENEIIVITGKLQHFKNRAELQAAIESQGGKVVGSVSKNTTYLINNDTESGSSKNLTAKKLGIKIISEQEFIQKFLTF